MLAEIFHVRSKITGFRALIDSIRVLPPRAALFPIKTIVAMFSQPGISPLYDNSSQVPASGFRQQFAGSIADRVYAISFDFVPAQHDAAPESKNKSEMFLSEARKTSTRSCSSPRWVLPPKSIGRAGINSRVPNRCGHIVQMAD